MFQFPAFALTALCVQAAVTGGFRPGRVSPFRNPRINARLPASRGLSQAPTSFVASRCQDIHRAPLVTWPPPPAAATDRTDARTRRHPTAGRAEGPNSANGTGPFAKKGARRDADLGGKTSGLGTGHFILFQGNAAEVITYRGFHCARAKSTASTAHFTLNLVFTCQRARQGHDAQASYRVAGGRPAAQSARQRDVERFCHRLNASDHYVAGWQSVRQTERNVLAMDQAH